MRDHRSDTGERRHDTQQTVSHAKHRTASQPREKQTDNQKRAADSRTDAIDRQRKFTAYRLEYSKL